MQVSPWGGRALPSCAGNPAHYLREWALPLSFTSYVCVSWSSAGCFSKLYLGAQRMCAQSYFRETKCHLQEVPQFFILWGLVPEQFILEDRGSWVNLGRWKWTKPVIKLEPTRGITSKGNEHEAVTLPRGALATLWQMVRGRSSFWPGHQHRRTGRLWARRRYQPPVLT